MAGIGTITNAMRSPLSEAAGLRANGMSIGDRLKADFSWMLSGNVLYSACQWFIVVVLAKLGTAEQVGEYALGLAISGPIILFANLQLRSLVASDVADRFSFKQYFTFRIVSLSAALLCVALVGGISTGAARLAGIVVLVGAVQALEFVSETYYGRMQKCGQMDRVSRSMIYRGALSLAALWIAMYFTRNLVWALVALGLGRLIVLLAWDAKITGPQDAFSAASSVVPRTGWNVDREDMLLLLRTALPLGVISLLASLNANIPRYFVQAYRGTAELGVYSAIASLLSAGTLVVSACGQAMFVPVAQAFSSCDRSEYRKYVSIAVTLGVMLGGSAIVLSAVFGKTILSHLFRPGYAQHAAVLVRLMIAGTVTFVALGLGFVMTAGRILGAQIPLLVVTGIAAAGACAILIPRDGLIGAANAVVLAAVVQLAGTGLILLRADRRFPHGREASSLSVGQVHSEAL